MKIEKVFKGSQKVELCDLIECTSTWVHINVIVFINNNEGQTWQHVSQPAMILVYVSRIKRAMVEEVAYANSQSGLGKQATL